MPKEIMSEYTIEEMLKKLMIDRCGIPEEKFRPDATLQGDLELDSLDAVELAMGLEDEFTIEVVDQDLVNVRTVRDLITLIVRKRDAA
ncbi:MAG TPA: acyl carrier protein [Nitrospirales bacterium]|jgi:acyl carrier protein